MFHIKTCDSELNTLIPYTLSRSNPILSYERIYEHTIKVITLAFSNQ